MPERLAPNARQRRVARRLREWRDAAGITQDEAAGRLAWSGPKLSRFERAEQVAGPAEIIAMATVLGVGSDDRDHLVSIATAAATQRGRWRSYGTDTVHGDFEDFLETEADALSMSNVEVLLVPGLLQTAEYAEALMRAWEPEPDEALTTTRTKLRLQRQARLDGTEPLHLHAITHEYALHLPVGGPWVMLRQLEQLCMRASQPNVTLQIIPASAGAYPGMATAYHLIYFSERESPVAFLDTLNMGLCLEDEDHIAKYTGDVANLREAACKESESMELLQDVRELWRSDCEN